MTRQCHCAARVRKINDQAPWKLRRRFLIYFYLIKKNPFTGLTRPVFDNKGGNDVAIDCL
jgi:hypothetical protein